MNGVGPHPLPWPTDARYDRELLAHGDRRNVIDRYRYWTEQAIKDDIRQKGVQLEIALENVERDFNMGTIVRTANAFGVSKVHIVGRKTWNKRGAMATDKYLEVVYHSHESFYEYVRRSKRHLIGIDITATSQPLSSCTLPNDALLVFGSEANGLSDALLDECEAVYHIEQFGSTRSINVGVAAGIALYQWVRDTGLTRYI